MEWLEGNIVYKGETRGKVIVTMDRCVSRKNVVVRKRTLLLQKGHSRMFASLWMGVFQPPRIATPGVCPRSETGQLWYAPRAWPQLDDLFLFEQRRMCLSVAPPQLLEAACRMLQRALAPLLLKDAKNGVCTLFERLCRLLSCVNEKSFPPC